MFRTNIYHVPGLCLLGIGGASYITHKFMAQKPYFHIFDLSEMPAGGASYYVKRLTKFIESYLLKV